jgi:hypothetical protein
VKVNGLGVDEYNDQVRLRAYTLGSSFEVIRISGECGLENRQKLFILNAAVGRHVNGLENTRCPWSCVCVREREGEGRRDRV